MIRRLPILGAFCTGLLTLACTTGDTPGSSHSQITLTETAQRVAVEAAGHIQVILSLPPGTYAELSVRSKPNPNGTASRGPQLLAQRLDQASPGRAIFWRDGVGRKLCWVGNEVGDPVLKIASREPSELDYIVEARWRNQRPAAEGDDKSCALLWRLAEAETRLHHDHDADSVVQLSAVVEAAVALGDPAVSGAAWLEAAHGQASLVGRRNRRARIEQRQLSVDAQTAAFARRCTHRRNARLHRNPVAHPLRLAHQ